MPSTQTPTEPLTVHISEPETHPWIQRGYRYQTAWLVSLWTATGPIRTREFRTEDRAAALGYAESLRSHDGEFVNVVPRTAQRG